MANSLITRRGGGSNIKGIVKPYTIKNNENILSGKFVDYIDNKTFIKNNAVIFDSNNIFPSAIIKIDKNRAMIIYRKQSISLARIVSFTDDVITNIGIEFQISSDYIDFFKTEILSNSKILISFRLGSSFKFSIISFNDLTILSITDGVTDPFNNITNLVIAKISATKVLITYVESIENNRILKTSMLNIYGNNLVFSSKIFTIDSLDSFSFFPLITLTVLNNQKAIIIYKKNNFIYAKILNMNEIDDININLEAVVIETDSNTYFEGIDNKPLITLDTSRVIFAYINIANNTIKAMVIDTTDNVLSVPNASFTVSNPSTSTVSLNFLSKSSVAVIYNSGSFAKVTILNIDNFSVSISGQTIDLYQKNSGSIIMNSIAIDKSRILISYQTPTTESGTLLFVSSDKILIPATEQIFGVAKKAGTGGDTIEIFADQTAEPFKVDQLIESYRVAFGQNISAGTFVDYINNGQSISYLNGSPTVFNSAGTGDISAVALGSDKIVVSYTNQGNSFYGTSIVGTISGSSISFGSPTVFNSDFTYFTSAVTLGSDKILVSYRNAGNSNYGTSIIGTVSGSSISWGSPTVFNSASTDYISAVALGSDKIVVSYRNQGLDRGTSVIGTITGSSISFGSPTVFNSASTRDISAVALGSDKIVVSYSNEGNLLYYGTSIIGTVSGSSISFGSPTVFNSTLTFSISAVDLSSDKIVVSYRNFGNSSYGTSIIGTVSGSSISFGSPTVFNSTSTFSIFAVALSSDKIVVSYRNDGNSSYGTSIIGTISGSSISFGSPTVFNSASAFYISAVVLSSDKIVVSYRNDGNLGRGTFIVGEIEKLIIPTDTNIFGLAKTGGVAGQIIDVYINK
jgi:hypothetical protein